ncbi:hypothetical protein HK097_010810, partial [Rhizophlyctis rosea]
MLQPVTHARDKGPFTILQNIEIMGLPADSSTNSTNLLTLSPELLLSIFIFIRLPDPFTKTCRAIHNLSSSAAARRAWLRARFPLLPELGRYKEYDLLNDEMGYAAPGYAEALVKCPVGLMGDEVVSRLVADWGVWKGLGVGLPIEGMGVEVDPAVGDCVALSYGKPLPPIALAATRSRSFTGITITSTCPVEPAKSIRLLLRLICARGLTSSLTLVTSYATSPTPTLRIAPDELGVLITFASWGGHAEVIDFLLLLGANTTQVVDDVLYNAITHASSLSVLKRGVAMIPPEKKESLLEKSIEWAVISAIPFPLSSPLLYGTGRRSLWTETYQCNIDVSQIIASFQTRIEKSGNLFEPSTELRDILSFLLRQRNAPLSDLKIDYSAFSEPQLAFFIRTALSPSPLPPTPYTRQPSYRHASLNDPFLTYDIYELILTRDYHHLLRFLLGIGFPVSPDATTHWPLRLACTHSSLKCTALLLSHGADARTAGDILLRDAAQRGNAPLVDLLSTYGADVKGPAGIDALCSAVRSGWVDVVEVLCRNGAEVGCLDEMPLRIAVARGSKGVVECLVKYGADVCRVLG